MTCIVCDDYLGRVLKRDSPKRYHRYMIVHEGFRGALADGQAEPCRWRVAASSDRKCAEPPHIQDD